MFVLKEAIVVPSVSTVTQCRLCGQRVLSQALSLGPVPVCNGFSAVSANDRPVSLDIVECEGCRLIQLRQAVTADELIPRVPWIRYREPEGHLSELIGAVLALRPDARSLLGAGPFEQPFLRLAGERGISTTQLTIEGSSVEGRYPYLETWQANLNGSRLSEARARFGCFDIVSCRYLVEHSATPVAALRALKKVLNPRGLVLIEVPDSSKFLRAKDYCFLWEEHCCYFVEETLRRLGEVAGYRVHAILRYPSLLEDALVAVMEPVEIQPLVKFPLGPSELFTIYRENFSPTREMLRTRLTQAAGPRRDRLALFGIGHHAIMFVNMFGLASNVALAVDDDPDKIGFFPPGFYVSVVNSAELLADQRIQTCLFTVSPNIMHKLRENLAALVRRGVEFRSIYAVADDYAAGPSRQ
jgi:SAM-dependent methyltransferase